ncbi:MAG: NAD-dependent epimerase/dehydratase family protein [Thermoguttaceae bacterium]
MVPDRIENTDELEDLLSRPAPGVSEDLAAVEGDLLILGVGGKVGPTLARMAKRAAPRKRVVAVARFSDPDVRRRLESWDIETISCDLFDRSALDALPALPNVIFMVGRKFGTTNDEPRAWATNVYLPGMVAERFAASRIVAFSTLCVYPFAPVDGPGFSEKDPPGAGGEYCSSCIGRERMFQHFSQLRGTAGRLIRLNYAIDLRYGVLHDVAMRVWQAQPIDLTTPLANVIWQGDSNAQILRAFRHCTSPTSPLNVGAPEHTSIRAVAERFGELFSKQPRFCGEPAATAWINDTSEAARLFGPPTVPLDRMIAWTADWISRGMLDYHKPTRYEVRDGRF